MAKFKYRDTRPPWMQIEAKKKVDPELAEQIEMVVLIALDAAHRGKATGSLTNTLTQHLMVGVLLWARNGNRALYDTAAAAWMAMASAAARPTELLDLTTEEYQAIKKALIYYIKAIPKLEAGVLVGVFIEAEKKLK